MLPPLVRMLVKVILVDLLFAQLTTKQFWLELYHTEVDVVKQENQEYMEKSISSKIGFEKVNTYSVTSILVMDIGDKISWWQLKDVSDGYVHTCMVYFYTSVLPQHSKNDANIEFLLPISKLRHQHHLWSESTKWHSKYFSPSRANFSCHLKSSSKIPPDTNEFLG